MPCVLMVKLNFSEKRGRCFRISISLCCLIQTQSFIKNILNVLKLNISPSPILKVINIREDVWCIKREHP